MKHFIEPELRAAFIDRAIRFDWILARIPTTGPTSAFTSPF